MNGFIATLSATNPAPSTGVWTKASGPGRIASPSSLNTTIDSLSKVGATTTVYWIVTNAYNCKDTAARTITPPTMDTTLFSKYSNQYCLTLLPVAENNRYSYYDLNGKLLAAVTDSIDGSTIGSTTFCGQLPYNVAGDPAKSDVQTVNSWLQGAGYLPQPYLPRAWNINTTSDAQMKIDLYFTDEEVAALTDATLDNGGYYRFATVSQLLLVAYPNNADTFIPAGSTGQVVYHPTFSRRGNYWQATFNTNRSGTFYLYPTYWQDSPLPVELISFTATPNDNSITLDWSTASEINNQKFEIERGLTTRSFVKIGEVAGAGNFRGTKSYPLRR